MSLDGTRPVHVLDPAAWIAIAVNLMQLEVEPMSGDFVDYCGSLYSVFCVSRLSEEAHIPGLGCLRVQGGDTLLVLKKE